MLNAIILDEKERVSKLVKALKNKVNLEVKIDFTDLNYYDLVFVSLNLLNEKRASFIGLKHLVILTNIDSAILKTELSLIFSSIYFLKYDFNQDELYRALEGISYSEEELAIANYLKSLGLKSTSKGFTYFVELTRLTVNNPSLLKSMMELYATIGAKYQVSSAQVERNIRYMLSKYNQEKGMIYTTSSFLLKVLNELLSQSSSND